MPAVTACGPEAQGVSCGDSGLNVGEAQSGKSQDRAHGPASGAQKGKPKPPILRLMV